MAKGILISSVCFLGIVYLFFRQYFYLPQTILLYLPAVFVLYLPSVFRLTSSSTVLQLYSLFFLFTIVIGSLSNYNIQDFYGIFILFILLLTSSLSNSKSIAILTIGIFLVSIISHYYVFISRFTNLSTGIDVTEQYIPSSQFQAISTIYFITLFFYLKNRLLRLTSFFLVFFSLGLQLLSFSRGGVILVVIIFILSIFYRIVKKGVNYFYLIFGLLFGLYFFIALIPIYGDLINFRLLASIDNGFSDEKRFEVYENAFNGIKNVNLVLGGGLSYYKFIHSTHPHNAFIQIVEDYGLFGFLLYFSSTILLLRNLFRKLKHVDLFKSFYFSLYFFLFIYFFISLMYTGNFYASFMYHTFCGVMLSLINDRRNYS